MGSGMFRMCLGSNPLGLAEVAGSSEKLHICDQDPFGRDPNYDFFLII